jgi:hypothetical protein
MKRETLKVSHSGFENQKKLLTFAARFNRKPPQQAKDKNIKKFFTLKLAK